MVDEVGLLLRCLYGYNSVYFNKRKQEASCWTSRYSERYRDSKTTSIGISCILRLLQLTLTLVRTSSLDCN